MLSACYCFLASITPAHAQVDPNEQTTALVEAVTDAFFDVLAEDNFGAERAFMTNDFAAATPADEWRRMREQTVAAIGPTPNYTPHQLTYYRRDTLLAAVDFSGSTAMPDVFVCGFVLWELIDANTIGFTRIEQNVLSIDMLTDMPTQKAVQLMTEWHCPTVLIVSVLGVTVQ